MRMYRALLRACSRVLLWIYRAHLWIYRALLWMYTALIYIYLCRTSHDLRILAHFGGSCPEFPYIGLFCGCIGLFGRYIGRFCENTGLFCGISCQISQDVSVRVFANFGGSYRELSCIGLFCRYTGLFCGYIGLFCR